MTAWRRSSFCSAGECVEVSCEQGACTEVAFVGAEILVRDSKDPDGPVLRFTADEWEAFVLGVAAGEFDA